MILRIREVQVCGRHSLRLEFNDGSTRRVDIRPLLEGPIFEPLRDPDYFARVSLDVTCGTVVWPNGADFAPEALRDLSAEATPDSACC
ncbi:DUF2442 domain-containing protein [Aquisphaera insulae]|uniref:DUF2442 domain-containing protein n=1 Tax=Aquisphaera insulae TaxID=2712864 RepID=UPI0013ED657E|nr:DUF2442 domain-containing protein [Aquisphaera insulae]